MPPIRATLQFVADIPLYEVEKPYMVLPGRDQDIDPEDERLSNLKFESHDNILIEDMRNMRALSLSGNGFEYLQHKSQIHTFQEPGDVKDYKHETQEMLAARFDAVKVITYEVRLRKNQTFARNEFDYFDPMLVEGPAVGAHNGKS